MNHPSLSPEYAKTWRSVPTQYSTRWKVSEILIPVTVSHSHLNASERIDTRSTRQDILEVEIEIEELSRRGMTSAWSPAELIEKITHHQPSVVTGPMEGVIDFIHNAATENLELTGAQSVQVRAKRRGLSVGSPILGRTWQMNSSKKPKPVKSYRETGFGPIEILTSEGNIARATFLTGYTPSLHQVERCDFDDLLNYSQVVSQIQSIKKQGRGLENAEVCRLIENAIYRQAFEQSLNLHRIQIEVSQRQPRCLVSETVDILYA